MSYTLTVDNSVEMVCRAVTDKVTPINVTNHAFFNLAGVRNNIDVLSHSLRLCSSQIIACDDNLVPTGDLVSVAGTVLDFRQSRQISDALMTDYLGIKQQKGFLLLMLYVIKKSALPLLNYMIKIVGGDYLFIPINHLCRYTQAI